MIKKFSFILLLFSGFAFSQSSKPADSLFLVKNYLLEIQNTVNSKESPKQKIGKLNALIKLVTTQKAVFNRNITKVVKNNDEAKTLKSSLNFILQSMVLHKSDLRVAPKPCGTNEAAYLNKNIPVLVDKIYFYCNQSKEIR